METFKLTTLALLIPFGALLCDMALAYPEQLGQSHSAVEQGAIRHCHDDITRRSDFVEWGADFGVLQAMIVDSFEPPSTTVPHHHRSRPIDTCRLDLDPIEVN